MSRCRVRRSLFLASTRPLSAIRRAQRAQVVRRVRARAPRSPTTPARPRQRLASRESMSLSFSHLSGLLATAAGPHLYWIASRAAGSAALILSSVSVCVGLLMGGRVLKRRWPDLRVAHEALSLATLTALAVHGLTLLGDGFLHPSLADISVPF